MSASASGTRGRLRAAAANHSAHAGPIAGLATYIGLLASELTDPASPRRAVAELLAEIPEELMAVDSKLTRMYGNRWADDVFEGIRWLDAQLDREDADE